MADQTTNADLSISADEIRDALKEFVKAYEPGKPAATEVGYVTDAGDGIAHVEGLPGVMANELIRFADGTLGLAQNLDENEIGVVVLGEFAGTAILALLAYYFIGIDEGAFSVFGNTAVVHEFFHDGRHFLGFPCH